MFVVGCLFVCHECVELHVVFLFKQKTAYELRISDWSSDVCSSDLDDEISATSGGVYVRFVVAALTTEQKLTRAQAKRLPRGAVMDQVIKQADTSRTKSQASELDDTEGITEAFARDFPHILLAAPTLHPPEAAAALPRMAKNGRAPGRG